jgi:hypothetical protein
VRVSHKSFISKTTILVAVLLAVHFSQKAASAAARVAAYYVLKKQGMGIEHLEALEMLQERDLSGKIKKIAHEHGPETYQTDGGITATGTLNERFVCTRAVSINSWEGPVAHSQLLLPIQKCKAIFRRLKAAYEVQKEEQQR